jgi:hypothetical protein
MGALPMVKPTQAAPLTEARRIQDELWSRYGAWLSFMYHHGEALVRARAERGATPRRRPYLAPALRATMKRRAR